MAPNGWIPGSQTVAEWIQLVLPAMTVVRGVMLETSLSEFTIQASTDGQVFEEIGIYNGTGNPFRQLWVRK